MEQGEIGIDHDRRGAPCHANRGASQCVGRRQQGRNVGQRVKKQRNLRFCNVLEGGLEARRLWQFDLSEKTTLAAEQSIPNTATLPVKAISKDWRTLWQKKLNIAWLPADQVFLRVVYLPAAEIAELRS